jgi:S-DNA-T family DNA segregation ATPase FtsK/SpoIIIE
MRERLEFMADRIEAVLALHRIPARVTGGTVTPRWVRFQVLPAIGAKISAIKGLNEELAAALDVPGVRISRRGAAVDVEIPRNDPQPVRLLPLLRQLTEDDDALPAMTATLGLAEDGAPLLIRLPSPDVSHILVAGAAGAGKTVLLQAVALALAMTNPSPVSRSVERSPTDLTEASRQGMLAVDCRAALALVLVGRAFAPFEGLPHLARPVVREMAEATEALQSLVRLMEQRGSRGDGDREMRPAHSGHTHVTILIDELDDLVAVGGEPARHALTRLIQRGCEAGIHVVAATREPSSAALGPLVKAVFPARLVGRVTSAEEARTATGWSGTGAERLLGRGDFLAVAEGRVMRFQVAHVSPDEVREVTAWLAQEERQERAVYLPWPVNRLSEVFR